MSSARFLPSSSNQKKNMSISTESELVGMKKASEAVAITLKEMETLPKSAPQVTYGFSGWTCTSLQDGWK